MLLLIAPAALLLLLFQVVPIVIGANASFRDWTLSNPKNTWIGYAHYISVITDPAFLQVALPNTFLFMLVSVMGALVIVLDSRRFCSTAASTGQAGANGAAPAADGRPGGRRDHGAVDVQRPVRHRERHSRGNRPQGSTLDGATLERVGVILLTDIWLWTPWFTLLLLAGPPKPAKEPFEAAAIDGTTPWRVFRHLTLPMLRPVIVVCVVIRSIDAFRTFDIVWTLTGGGPARSTELFSLYAYVDAFFKLELGRGSAAAIIGGLIILMVGGALYRIVNRVVRV